MNIYSQISLIVNFHEIYMASVLWFRRYSILDINLTLEIISKMKSATLKFRFTTNCINIFQWEILFSVRKTSNKSFNYSNKWLKIETSVIFTNNFYEINLFFCDYTSIWLPLHGDATVTSRTPIWNHSDVDVIPQWLFLRSCVTPHRDYFVIRPDSNLNPASKWIFYVFKYINAVLLF